MKNNSHDSSNHQIAPTSRINEELNLRNLRMDQQYRVLKHRRRIRQRVGRPHNFGGYNLVKLASVITQDGYSRVLVGRFKIDEGSSDADAFGAGVGGTVGSGGVVFDAFVEDDFGYGRDFKVGSHGWWCFVW